MKNLVSNLALAVSIGLAFCLPVYASYVIPNGAVTTAKLASGAVSQVKKEIRSSGTTASAGGVAISASSGVFVNAGTSYVSALAVTLDTLGGPVRVYLIPDGSNQAYLGNPAFGAQTGFFRILRDGSPVSEAQYKYSATGAILMPPSQIETLDIPPAGTHTYTLQVYASAVAYSKLVAYEL